MYNSSKLFIGLWRHYVTAKSFAAVWVMMCGFFVAGMPASATQTDFLFNRYSNSYYFAPLQGWIQECALEGGAPVPFLSLLSSPLRLEVGPLKPVRGSGERCKLPSGSGVEPWPKTNSVHSNAVRKPLVAIILSILKSCVLLDQHLALAIKTYQEYRDGVGRSVAQGGLGHLSKSATAFYFRLCHISAGVLQATLVCVCGQCRLVGLSRRQLPLVPASDLRAKNTSIRIKPVNFKYCTGICSHC